MVQVVQTPSFGKSAKRLHANQKADLDVAVRTVLSDPDAGEKKAGDLSWLRVFKFRMVNQLALLAYEYVEADDTLILHALGSHENFYRDLKAK